MNLIVITEPLKRVFLHNFFMPSNKITVLPDGADMPTVKNNAIDFINDKLNVGYTGHLYKGRGINLIIELARRSKWAFFHIVGGNVGDIEKLKKNTMGIDNLKIYGFLSPKETEKIRLNMDVLLAPYQKKVMLSSGKLSTEEWMSPLKVFEYMAAGKAIIASDLPVLHEVLENGRNCIMCPPSSTEVWLDALNKLNHNQKLRESLGKTAQEDLKLKYTWNIRAKRILEVATQV
jgi:glycosyltransferase involved in cell wall biosynthesis